MMNQYNGIISGIENDEIRVLFEKAADAARDVEKGRVGLAAAVYAVVGGGFTPLSCGDKYADFEDVGAILDAALSMPRSTRCEYARVGRVFCPDGKLDARFDGFTFTALNKLSSRPDIETAEQAAAFCNENGITAKTATRAYPKTPRQAREKAEKAAADAEKAAENARSEENAAAADAALKEQAARDAEKAAAILKALFESAFTRGDAADVGRVKFLSGYIGRVSGVTMPDADAIRAAVEKAAAEKAEKAAAAKQAVKAARGKVTRAKKAAEQAEQAAADAEQAAKQAAGNAEKAAALAAARDNAEQAAAALAAARGELEAAEKAAAALAA